MVMHISLLGITSWMATNLSSLVIGHLHGCHVQERMFEGEDNPSNHQQGPLHHHH